MRAFLALSVLLIASGCTTVSDAGYFWGDYSSTSYLIVNEPSDKSVRVHADELRRIIDKSNEKGLKVPPGIHAELGFMLSKLGELDQAKAEFEKEVKIYPESEVFLERLMQQGRQSSAE